MLVFRRRGAWPVIWLVAILMGCGGSSSNRELPTELEISFGQGGGVTGIWRGYTLDPEGTLFEWEGPSPREKRAEAGIVGERGRLAMWKAICRSGILELGTDERSNMTRTIRVVADGSVHEAYWPLSIRTNPTNLDPLYEELSTLVVVHRAQKPRSVAGGDGW
jgi:hypothetical protein